MKADIRACHIIALIIYLMVTLCGCLATNNVSKSDKIGSDNFARTLGNASSNTTYDRTNMTPLEKNNNTNIGNGNETGKNSSGIAVSVTEQITDTSGKDPEEAPLPIPLMVASPAVAVGIFIFICIAYKWHTAQLDAQARKLAEQVTSGQSPSPCIPCSPCHNTQRLLLPSQSAASTSLYHSDSDLMGARRKSLRTPSPVLLLPPGLGNHRGSSWSALSDQEVVNHSPRRHSTFLLWNPILHCYITQSILLSWA